MTIRSNNLGKDKHTINIIWPRRFRDVALFQRQSLSRSIGIVDDFFYCQIIDDCHQLLVHPYTNIESISVRRAIDHLKLNAILF